MRHGKMLQFSHCTDAPQLRHSSGPWNTAAPIDQAPDACVICARALRNTGRADAALIGLVGDASYAKILAQIRQFPLLVHGSAAPTRVSQRSAIRILPAARVMVALERQASPSPTNSRRVIPFSDSARWRPRVRGSAGVSSCCSCSSCSSSTR